MVIASDPTIIAVVMVSLIYSIKAAARSGTTTPGHETIGTTIMHPAVRLSD